jgi:hypothetical protein
MLKINVGWSQERLAQQIAFGLSEDNLTHLRHDPDAKSPTGPIAIKGDEIGLEEGNHFCIFAAEKDPEAFTSQFSKMLEPLRPTGEVAVMNIDESFYVAPVPSEKGIVWFIGLHEVSYKKLRAGELLTFRARMIEGEGQNVEVNIFWAETNKGLAEQLGVQFEYGTKRNVPIEP